MFREGRPVGGTSQNTCLKSTFRRARGCPGEQSRGLSALLTIMQDIDSPWSRLCGLEPMSLCDWPGRVCAVLFLGGCDLRCPTCHNAPLAWDPPAAPRLSRNQLLNHLRRRAPWLDGVTVTGGEATLSADLPAWLAELNQETGLALKLDSNGMHPDVLDQALKVASLELVAVDIKGPWVRYPELTGQRVSGDQARERLEAVFDLARAHPDRFCFRTTLVPTLTPEDLAEVRGLPPPGFIPRFQPYRAPAPPLSREGLHADVRAKNPLGQTKHL